MTEIVTQDTPRTAGTGRGRLRESMPLATAFLDACREAFGAAGIDASIAAGMRGEPDRFHAREGGMEIGTRFTVGTSFAHDGTRWVRIDA